MRVRKFFLFQFVNFAFGFEGLLGEGHFETWQSASDEGYLVHGARGNAKDERRTVVVLC